MSPVCAALVVLALCSTPVCADDCELAKRYFKLATEAKAAFDDRRAFEFLNRAAQSCARFEYWQALGESAEALADQESGKRAAEAFVEAYNLAGTPEERSAASARYAELLFNDGDPQRAIRYAYYAKNLTPAVGWIEELTGRIAQRVAEVRPEDITRGLNEPVVRPLLLISEHGTERSPKPAPAAVASNGVAINVPINFEYDRTAVDERTTQNVATLARVLAGQHYVDKRFVFVGHSDLRGADDYNRVLSLRRAIELKNEVQSIEPSLQGRIETVGRGKDEPLSLSPSEEDQRMNRRLEVKLK
jgi:outer membrane protein OmpA-like peptidoglycan-associated protein